MMIYFTELFISLIVIVILIIFISIDLDIIKLSKRKETFDEEIEEKIENLYKAPIGTIGIVLEVSKDGKSLKVEVLGIPWMALKKDPNEKINKGDKVMVVEQDHNILKVKKAC